MQLKIDPEFRDVIFALKEQELKQLEENILRDGQVLNPIIAWGDTIIDGHNRWNIIQKHPELPYTIKQMEFKNRYDAISWICKNQYGRRNLTEEQKSYIRGKQYEAEKMSIPNAGGVNQHSEVNGQNVRQPKSRRDQKDGTAGRIGKEHGVNGRTIRRDADFAKGVDTAEKLSPGLKDAVLSGEVKAPKAVIASIPTMPEAEQKQTVQAIVTGKTMSTREMGKLFDQITAESAEKEQQAYTAEDLKEELDALVSDFSRKVESTLSVHSALLSGEEGVKKATAALSEAETAIKKIKELIPRA